jgi:hypothetical protein
VYVRGFLWSELTDYYNLDPGEERHQSEATNAHRLLLLSSCEQNHLPYRPTMEKYYYYLYIRVQAVQYDTFSAFSPGQVGRKPFYLFPPLLQSTTLLPPYCTGLADILNFQRLTANLLPTVKPHGLWTVPTFTLV